MRRTLATVAVTAAVASLAACGSGGGSDKKADNALGLIQAGTLTVCSDVPYAPFEDFDKSSKSGFKGFDVDIVQAVADGLGVKLQIKDSAFDALESGLAVNSGQCDLVASAMTISDDRKKALLFSDGYFDSAQSLLVPTGSSIKGLGDLKGKKVGVQVATTGKTYAEKNATGAQVVTFPSDAEMYSALKAGQVDALLQDYPVNYTHQEDARQPGKYTVVETYPTKEEYGLATKLGKTKLIDAVNEQLTTLHDNGTYDELYKKWVPTK